MHKTQILHLELIGQLPLAPSDHLLCLGKEQVINIQHQDQRTITSNLVVKVGIRITLGEARTQKISINLQIPSFGCLLESIQGFLQATRMGLLPMNHKALKLLYIHLFLNNTIEERSLHIHLVKSPTHNKSKGDNSSNRGVPDHWSKCLIIIHYLSLRESTCHEPSFVLLDVAIRCMLDFVDSSRSHHRLPLRSRYYLPQIILHDGLVFLHHGISPSLLVYSLLRSGRI